MAESEKLEFLALPEDKVAYVYGENGERLKLRRVKIYDEEDLIAKLKSAKPVFYGTISTSLAAARTGKVSEAFDVAGDFFAVSTLGSVTCHVIFNEVENPKIKLVDGQTITTPFYRFWLVHAALTGETIEITVGREKLFRMDGV